MGSNDRNITHIHNHGSTLMKKYKWIGTLEVETNLGPYTVTRYGDTFGSVLSQFSSCTELYYLEENQQLSDEKIHIRQND